MGDRAPFKSFRKIIWAVDVFERDRKMQETAAKTLQCMTERFGAAFEVVHILNLHEIELAGQVDGAWESFYERAAESAVQQLLESVHLNSPVQKCHVHIILQRTSSNTHDSVDLLIRYAEERGADLLLVTTHGRSGVKRAVLGSFAETLLLRSSVPVMTVGPQMAQSFRNPLAIKSLLFPTDFQLDAKSYFRRAVALALQLQSKITLFHSVPHPIEPMVQSGVNLLGASWFPLYGYFGEQVERQTERAQAWARWAMRQGVEADYVIHAEGGSIPEVVCSLAQDRDISMILMVEKTGPVASALIGSITRQVVRHSPCPVFILSSLNAQKKDRKPSHLRRVA